MRKLLKAWIKDSTFCLSCFYRHFCRQDENGNKYNCFSASSISVLLWWRVSFPLPFSLFLYSCLSFISKRYEVFLSSVFVPCLVHHLPSYWTSLLPQSSGYFDIIAFYKYPISDSYLKVREPVIHEYPHSLGKKKAGSKLQIQGNFGLHSVFQVSWGYIARSCLKKHTKKTKWSQKSRTLMI